MSDEERARKLASERARGLAEERARRRAANRKGHLNDRAIDRVLDATRKAGGKALSKYEHKDTKHQAKVNLKFAISIAFTSRNVVERKSELDFVSTIVSAQKKGSTLASAVAAAMAKIVADSPPRVDWVRLSSTPGDAFMDGLAKAYEVATGAKAIRTQSARRVVSHPCVAFIRAILKETKHSPMSDAAIRKALLRKATGQKF